MMKKVMMLIVAVLTGSVFAGPDVMAMWGADDARAKKVLAALADEGECYVIASATKRPRARSSSRRR